MEGKEIFEKGPLTCLGCGLAIATRIITRNILRKPIIVLATGCLEVTTTQYPYTHFNCPVIHGAFENAPAVASGIYRALRAQGIEKEYDVVVLAGDGATFDIGFQSLSGMFERGEEVCYVCLDNEAYMNCLPADTIIMTKNGAKRIDELFIGEEVYVFNLKTHEIDLRKCVGIFDNGIRDVFEIETLHHSIRATPNHPFLTIERRGRWREREFKWKTLKQLKVGDEIIVLKNLEGGSSYKFNFTPVKKGEYKVNKLNEIEIPTTSSKELLEYLGLFLGDGWVRADRGEVGFAIPEGPSRKLLLRLHSRIFGDFGIGRMDDVYVYFYSVNLARFINSLGFGNGAKNKTIPAWIFTLPKEEKEAFIDGLLNSDGYKIERSCRYVSSSFELLKKLRLLLQTMNYRVGKIHWIKVEKSRECAGRKLLKDTAYGYICFSKRKRWDLEKYRNQYEYQNPLIENKYFDVERIRSIRYIGKLRVFDLRVENDHNFLAEGIVVHNTGVQRSSATPIYAFTTTTPSNTIMRGKMEERKQIALIFGMHNLRYVATATLAYHVDLITKLKKALQMKPSFLQILTPCPTGWGFNSEDTIKISKLAVETGFFPLFEIEDCQLKLNQKITERTPVKEFLKLQKRFSHLKDEEIDKIQEIVDRNCNYLLEIEKAGKIFYQFS